MQISVIICTHNPRADYLRRVLEALQAQTLPKGQWELLLVDNASREPLAGRFDLSWHPNARHIREEELGLTPARLRGISESVADLLVFVDDDNVLDPDNLKVALEVASAYPHVAVWCGNIRPEFEIEPAPAIRPYLNLLALREVTRDVWANVSSAGEVEPCGAGMCMRRHVALKYREELQTNPRRKSLDRKGTSLVSGGDNDMAYTACDLGMGMGQFSRLRLKHLIPAARLTETYMLRLVEGSHYSTVILHHLRGNNPNWGVLGFRARLRDLFSCLTLRGMERRAYFAAQRGKRSALKLVANSPAARS